MYPVGKESDRQRCIEEENRRLDEAAKKKQKRQLEEISQLERAASRKLEKQTKKALYLQHLTYEHQDNRLTDKYNEMENQIEEESK